MTPLSSVGQRPHHEPQEPNSQQGQGYKVMTQTPILKLFNFYAGVALCLCGVGAFLVSATSRKWVELKVDVGVVSRSTSHRRMLSHMGPWLACDYGNHCDKLWILAPGLDERSVRGVQTMLLLVILIYLTGAAVIIFQLLRPKRLLELKTCKCLLDHAIAEGLIPIAAVMAFIFMLMMGELKRKLILQPSETAQPGWAFVVCLVSVLATIFGSLCMVFNRQGTGCAKAYCNTMFGEQATQRSSVMLQKSERVRRDLVTRSLSPQHSDLAGVNGDIDVTDEIYQISETGVRHRQLENRELAEERCRSDIHSLNFPGDTEVISRFNSSEEEIAIKNVGCEHTSTEIHGNNSVTKHSTKPIDTGPLVQKGGVQRIQNDTHRDIAIDLVGRPHPRPLDKPGLLETQADWLTFYSPDSQQSGDSELTELGDIQSGNNINVCSEISETQKKHTQQKHQAQGSDCTYKTGQVTL